MVAFINAFPLRRAASPVTEAQGRCVAAVIDFNVARHAVEAPLCSSGIPYDIGGAAAVWRVDTARQLHKRTVHPRVSRKRWNALHYKRSADKGRRIKRAATICKHRAKVKFRAFHAMPLAALMLMRSDISRRHTPRNAPTSGDGEPGCLKSARLKVRPGSKALPCLIRPVSSLVALSRRVSEGSVISVLECCFERYLLGCRFCKPGRSTWSP